MTGSLNEQAIGSLDELVTGSLDEWVTASLDERTICYLAGMLTGSLCNWPIG